MDEFETFSGSLISLILHFIYRIALWFSLNNRLRQAVYDDDVEHVYKSIRNGANLNCRGSKNMSYLFIANNNLKGISREDQMSYTPLHIATTNGRHVNIIKLLAASGNTNLKDIKGRTPLIILANGDGSDPTCYSSMEVLLHRHADTDITDNSGLNALQTAIKKDTAPFVDLLVSNGTLFRISHLFLAARCSSLKTIYVMFKKGVNINTADSDGNTVFAYAATSEVIHCVIDCGAKVNQTNMKGQTPLMYTIIYGDHSKSRATIEKIQALIEGGADVNMTGPKHQTALFFALRMKNDRLREDCVECLLIHGADPMIEDESKTSAKDYAFTRSDLANYFKMEELIDGSVETKNTKAFNEKYTKAIAPKEDKRFDKLGKIARKMSSSTMFRRKTINE